MLTKSRTLLTAIILLTVVAATACISQAPPAATVLPTQDLTTVRVAYIPIISNGPLFIAKEEGYFARQGIDARFEKFQSGTAAIPALINGDVAVAGGGISAALINSISKGAHVRIVADKGRNTPGAACNASGLVVRRDLYESGALTTVSDLKGKKIMAPSGLDWRVYRLLKMGNLTSDDVEIVSMDFTAGVVALSNGAIDAADLTEPYLTHALDSRAAVMFIPTEVSVPDYPTPLFYGPVFLDRDPDLGRRFMVAYLEGVRQYNLGKTERNIEILANNTGLDRDLLRRTCWLPIARDGDLPREPVRDFMEWMSENKQITQIPGDDQLYDMSYVQYANGVLGNSTG